MNLPCCDLGTASESQAQLDTKSYLAILVTVSWVRDHGGAPRVETNSLSFFVKGRTRSLRLANSDTANTMAAVMRYLGMIRIFFILNAQGCNP
jgi:hypothetical protein